MRREWPQCNGGERHWAPRGWARAIAELDGLLYLALRYDQWQELWSHTDRMPALAVAFLAGKTPYDKVADWIAQVNARTIDRRPAAQQTHHGHR
jgi:hypothetical protein